MIERRRTVRFDWADTRLGPCLVAATDRGVCFSTLGPGMALERLCTWLDAHEPGAECVQDAASLARAVGQLETYFRGQREPFDVELDLRGTPFQRCVWDALRGIPYGETRTYGEVARGLGKPGAVRAVGGANGRNPVPPFVPCHRVVAGDGIGGFSAGLALKRALLALENVRVFRA